ncbi:methyltransferase domain-containing protein [Saccharothrix violaceirubra]|uniref:Protein-L-isoaspartate O-methyltransferase n=1 Tax=Saccharothrix violaceirubra TaxID=413306 RepID=A0A7W7T4A1_9PSEU|nr:methyltransferase domain-containing protein [Saccharothrix violaceirubra]MBB4966056.1 protein-L-isoaspartate(D-aspartate) O-methyltransferase [Saccharothrix violaceirubra]
MTRTHADLVADLRAANAVPAGWGDVFAAIDRGVFVPDRCWVDDEHGRPVPLDRDAGPHAWAQAVYSDVPIVTQLDDGATEWPATSRNATSSASQPSLVLEMLDALHVAGAHQVLEIGTGTGYNAGLLAARLGEERVVTVEVDPDLADRARRVFKNAGLAPTVVTGDGADGYPERAPYDRVLSTAAVTAGRVPLEWVEQTRPGGELVMPWRTAWGGGVLVRLMVHEGTGAAGSVLDDAHFMTLRDQRVPFGQAARFGRLAAGADVPRTTTGVSPHVVVHDPDAAFVVGVLVGGARHSVARDDADHWELLVFHTDSGSWATVRVTPEATAAGRYEVRQDGPRRLWDEVESAHRWWIDHDSPLRQEFGLAVTPRRQTVWLCDPDTVVATYTT